MKCHYSYKSSGSFEMFLCNGTVPSEAFAFHVHNIRTLMTKLSSVTILLQNNLNNRLLF